MSLSTLERVSVGFCDSDRKADGRTRFPSPETTQARGPLRPSSATAPRLSRTPSISSGNFYDASPINSNRIISNAQSSFPEPSPECPEPAKTLDNETGTRIRKDYLIGKTIKGILMRRRGGYFIKWNDELTDAVFVSEECVTRDIGDKKQKGLVAVVKCTIEKLGPGYADWKKQHPWSSKVELVHRYWNSWHRRQTEKEDRGNTVSLARQTMSARSQSTTSRSSSSTRFARNLKRHQSVRRLSVGSSKLPADSDADRRNASGKPVWRPRHFSRMVSQKAREAGRSSSMEG